MCVRVKPSETEEASRYDDRCEKPSVVSQTKCTANDSGYSSDIDSA